MRRYHLILSTKYCRIYKLEKYVSNYDSFINLFTHTHRDVIYTKKFLLEPELRMSVLLKSYLL